ncbi:TonB-dependent receptor [Steroidobacter agaridevorans]|uniref:TonB-dependent receptor n=1 Tax=Steroidobacter agaridevorans TaxID=2695856 RepID=UPI00137A1543|nr:TonB-dependent receptor [Steroidobacter agaridevorans]
MSSTVQGQDVARPDEPRAVLEEVVVSAQWRDERLQDVPIATTVLSGSELRRDGIIHSSRLAQVTPNLTYSGGFETIPKIALRGVVTNDFIQNLNPAVGTYVDDVYVGLGTAQAMQLYDMERVEVLRGPQGTLYGKNTTAGAINYVSAKPRLGSTDASLSAGVGSYDLREADAALNAAIGERAASRVSLTWRDRGGFVDNLHTGRNARALKFWGARGQLFLKPSDGFDALLKVFAGERDGDALNRMTIGTLSPVAPAPGSPRRSQLHGIHITGYEPLRAPHVTESDGPTYDRVDEQGASLTMRGDLGFAEIKAITGYGRVERDALDDVDGSPHSLLQLGYGNVSRFVSQELRLSSEEGRFSWKAGAHFYEERHDVDNRFRFFDCLRIGTCSLLPLSVPGDAPAAAGYPPFAYFPEVFPPAPELAGASIATSVNWGYEQENRSYAAFGEGSLQLTDRLTTTLGLRHTTERRVIDAYSHVSFIEAADYRGPLRLFPGYDSAGGSKRWDNVSGRFVLEYELSRDALLYASVATGFRSGNWNGGAYSSPAGIRVPVDPETLASYELGLKSEWFDRRLRANLSGFYSDYEDLQVSVFANSTQMQLNAANAEIFGAEAELAAVPVPGLTARLALGWMPTAKYVDFNDGRGVDLSGNRMILAPEVTATAALDFDYPISSRWTVSAGGDVRYQTRTHFTVYNHQHLSQGEFATTNLRASLHNLERDYGVRLLVRNLFDKAYGVDGNTIGAPFGFDAYAWGEPRMWSASFFVNFN